MDSNTTKNMSTSINSAAAQSALQAMKTMTPVETGAIMGLSVSPPVQQQQHQQHPQQDQPTPTLSFSASNGGTSNNNANTIKNNANNEASLSFSLSRSGIASRSVSPSHNNKSNNKSNNKTHMNRFSSPRFVSAAKPDLIDITNAGNTAIVGETGTPSSTLSIAVAATNINSVSNNNNNNNNNDNEVGSPLLYLGGRSRSSRHSSCSSSHPTTKRAGTSTSTVGRTPHGQGKGSATFGRSCDLAAILNMTAATAVGDVGCVAGVTTRPGSASLYERDAEGDERLAEMVAAAARSKVTGKSKGGEDYDDDDDDESDCEFSFSSDDDDEDQREEDDCDTSGVLIIKVDDL